MPESSRISDQEIGRYARLLGQQAERAQSRELPGFRRACVLLVRGLDKTHARPSPTTGNKASEKGFETMFENMILNMFCLNLFFDFLF